MKTRRVGGLVAIVGGALLSLASLAHAAPFAYITQSFTNQVTVVDTANNSVVTSFQVGSGPFGAAVHPAGTHVFVSNMEEGTVSVIDTARVGTPDDPVVAIVTVEGSPAGLAVHPDGSRVWVANQGSGTVSVIDVALAVINAPNPVVATINVGGGPLGVAVNPAGTRVYVVNNRSASVSVIDPALVGTSSDPVVATVSLDHVSGVDERPVGVAVHPSGSRVYVTNAGTGALSVLDTATNTVVTTVPVGTSPRGVAVHPSGSHVYVANGGSSMVPATVAAVATATLTVTSTVPVGDSIYGIAVTPSGGQVVVASQNDGAVYSVDLASNAVSAPVAVDEGPTAFGLFITPAQAGGGCDTSALDKALAEARAQVTALQAAKQALVADNGRLQGDLTTVRATIDSFLDRLFGEGLDGKIAAAARAVALSDLEAAKAVAPKSWRVRHAQQSFEQGDKAMRRRDWLRAVREFREVHAIVEWILGDRRPVPAVPPTGTGPAPVAGGTSGSFPGCDTSALDQALATAASLQAAIQTLTAENLRLRTELATAKATVTSFVLRLFGEGSDGNVAAVARDAAREKLTKAQTAVPHDRRLRLAQQSFDHGQYAMKKQDWGRAVHEFREAHAVSERILKDKHAHWHGHGHRW